MRYKPRNCFRFIHETPWHRAYVIAHRRAGKSFVFAAEMLRRAYNGPTDGQYLFISPLAEQSEANVYGMFKGFDDEGYITRYKDRIITLANGATITFGGARMAEKFRGQYLDGCVFDEYSQIPPHIFAEIISFCLADRNGWCAFIGTARSDDDYRLYKQYKVYADKPNWLTKIVTYHDNEEAFPPERIEEMRDEHYTYCLSNGYTKEQADQKWLCEMECDFSFIDEGRPDMQALFYNELQQLFDANPPRVIDPSAAAPFVDAAERIAVFDISHSVDRDYTAAFFGVETPTTPIIYHAEWENNKPLTYWFDRLRALNVQTVALPFDAARTSKETLLTLYQTFRREGFNIIKIKRLQRPEQVENGRWLINNAKFSRDVIPALSELGKFREWKTKHGLEQDILSAFLYAGQVFRKKDIKKLLAEKVSLNYNKNRSIYNNAVSFFNGVAS